MNRHDRAARSIVESLSGAKEADGVDGVGDVWFLMMLRLRETWSQAEVEGMARRSAMQAARGNPAALRAIVSRSHRAIERIAVTPLRVVPDE